MLRIMLIGETGSGKSALVRALAGESYVPRRAMAVEFFAPFVIAPGEFLENRRFYPALITTASDCATLLFLQSATRRASLFPPVFALMFTRRMLGVVTHVAAPDANPDRAERFLRAAGAREISRIDAVTGAGLDGLREVAGLE